MPRSLVLQKPNCSLMTRNGCSTLALIRALALSTHCSSRPSAVAGSWRRRSGRRAIPHSTSAPSLSSRPCSLKYSPALSRKWRTRQWCRHQESSLGQGQDGQSGVHLDEGVFGGPVTGAVPVLHPVDSQHGLPLGVPPLQLELNGSPGVPCEVPTSNFRASMLNCFYFGRDYN